MEMRGVGTLTPQSCYSPCSRPPRIATKILRSDVLLPDNLLFSSNLRVKPSGFPRISLRCNAIGDSGGNECKAMLDAFFLGKALGEVINDRIQSTVGKFFSVIGGLQADFLKQAQEFQEDVLERASRVREEAMREAKDGIELVSKSIEEGVSAVDDVASNASTDVSSAMDNVTETASSIIGDVTATTSSAVDDVTATASSAIDAAHDVVKRSADRFPKIIPKPGNDP
ncbi:uncharacterized protein [Primulina huaijiensis]|uniref:uncharacterized protein n=1 Tax=Primulina huaijiensis TaxID=1492673 RepID=UPI003CC6ECB9